MPSRRIPFAVHISYLFIGLLVGFAVITNSFHFRESRRLITEEVAARFALIGQNTIQSIENTVRGATAASALLAKQHLMRASNLEQRLDSLEALAARFGEDAHEVHHRIGAVVVDQPETVAAAGRKTQGGGQRGAAQVHGAIDHQLVKTRAGGGAVELHGCLAKHDIVKAVAVEVTVGGGIAVRVLHEYARQRHRHRHPHAGGAGVFLGTLVDAWRGGAAGRLDHRELGDDLAQTGVLAARVGLLDDGALGTRRRDDGRARPACASGR